MEKKANHTVSVMNLLALSSKFTLQCLLCDNGQDSLFTVSTMLSVLSVEGGEGTSQGGRRPLLHVSLCCILLFLAPDAWSISDACVWEI